MQKTIVLMLAFCSLGACTSSLKNPIVIGHRGAKGHAAENTLPSIRQALDLGVDAIEVDVFRCATGELVVFHDKTLEKLTNATGAIEELPLDSIQKITVLGQAPIPTLAEVLDEINGSVVLNIELKGSQTALPTHALLQRYFEQQTLTPNDILISSFDWEELKIFFQNNTNVPIAVLTEDDPLDALPIAQQLKAVAINPDFRTLNKSNVKKIQAAGYKIYPWTVNAPADIEKLKSLGVDGIITDYPERVFP